MSFESNVLLNTQLCFVVFAVQFFKFDSWEISEVGLVAFVT